MTSTTDIKFDFKGLDHVALVVRDMKETVDFYHGVLDMPVLHTAEFHDDDGEVIGQHWFFGAGDPANPDAHIAAFWWKDGYQTVSESDDSTAVKPKNVRATVPVGAMMHFNLRVDPDKMQAYCAKLAALGIPFRHSVRYPSDPDEKREQFCATGMRSVDALNEYIVPDDGALMNSVYVTDPNGIQVEFNAWLPGWEKWPNDAVALSNDR